MTKGEKVGVILMAIALLIRAMHTAAVLGVAPSPIETVAIILFSLGIATLVVSHKKE